MTNKPLIHHQQHYDEAFIDEIFKSGIAESDLVKGRPVPLSYGAFAEHTDLYGHLVQFMALLLKNQPANPVHYLIDLFKDAPLETHQIWLLGAPCSGKATLGRMLALHLQCCYVDFDSLMSTASYADRVEALEHKERHMDLPTNLARSLITNRLLQPDCMRSGWILVGYPQNADQLLLLQQVGLMARRVVMLNADFNTLDERAVGKLLDPETGVVYHMEHAKPDDINHVISMRDWSAAELRAKWRNFIRELPRIKLGCSGKMKIFQSDKPTDEIFPAILQHVAERNPPARPHPPRIVLLGAPGSGKALIAKCFAEKYDLVDVCSGTLLKAIAKRTDLTISMAVKHDLNSGQSVSDNLVCHVVLRRLLKEDCALKGYILRGFPRNAKQASVLEYFSIAPNRTILLDVDQETCTKRLTTRIMNRNTGSQHNLPEFSNEIRAGEPGTTSLQLHKQHPKDSENAVRERMRAYAASIDEVLHHYESILATVDAAAEPQTVFEVVEKIAWSPKPVSTTPKSTLEVVESTPTLSDVKLDRLFAQKHFVPNVRAEDYSKAKSINEVKEVNVNSY